VSDRLEQAIRAPLAARRPGTTICPSDVARAVGGGDWRELMQPVRDAAIRLVAAGEVEVRQGGRPVDPRRARAPIRIGLT